MSRKAEKYYTLEELQAAVREKCLQEWRDLTGQDWSESAMRDFRGFTQDLEAAYRALWKAWCARHSPMTKES